MKAPSPHPFVKDDRIELLRMDHDPNPVPVGSKGTVIFCSWVIDRWQVVVKWDNGRSLNLVMPPDIAIRIR